ncbi:VMAP-C domain-containing protein [Streptomyces sp. NPDC001700]
MGWFHPRGSAPRPAVSILAKDDGRPAGAGVLLPHHHLLTCAHVVNSALGKDMLAPDHPGAVTVPVRMRGPEHTVEAEAELTAWIPPRRDDGGLGAFEWNGDLAVLRLAPGALPLAFEPPRWHPMARRQFVRAWHGSGEPGVFADAEVSACDGRFGYFDGAERTLDVEPAYSGGPLWSSEESAVVGLVTAKLRIQGSMRRAWGIPWQRVARELRHAGVDHLLPRPDEDVRDHPVYAELTALLDGPLSLSEGWVRYCRAVARQCGLDHRADGAPTADEFARVLLSRGRALPALVEAVRPASGPTADALLALGRRRGLPKLLTPGEYEWLLRLLRALPPASAAGVPGAVRAALSLAALPSALLAGFDGETCGGTGRFEALIAHLEGLYGDGSPGEDVAGLDGGMTVPGLLRAVEFVSAGCCQSAAQRAELRHWNEAVARRLGVHDAALRDRRHDARRWARGPERGFAPPRVVAKLSSCGPSAVADPDEPERYRLRLWCDDGDGLRQVSDDSERPRSTEEAAREILDAVGSLRRPDPAGPRFVIELIVDRDALEVPADSWKPAGGLLPLPLGAPYPLVVNCPELRELNGEAMLDQWRERWARLDAEEPVHIDDASAPDPEAVCGLLMERLTAHVTVDVAADRRAGVVQMCLAAGVPVVLWDRGGQPGSPAVRHAAEVRARELPEEIRRYRTKTLQKPAEYPGRPVLAWADAGRALPRLDLVDPTE